MADSRSEMLTRIRAAKVPPVPRPAPFADGIRYADIRRQFAEVLAFVGGKAVTATSPDEAWQELVQSAVIRSAKKIGSVVESLPPDGATHFSKIVRLDQISDPHNFQDLDVAILPGDFAVAENGAVWVPATGFPHRVLPFITQHLVLVVPAAAIVHNMHEAYDRLYAEGDPFAQAGFGAFIAGPSKTADIEQSLVIGAHGPRSHTVVLLG